MSKIDDVPRLCTADVCPHGASSSLCEWCMAKWAADRRLNIIREHEMREDLLKKENAKLKELVREAYNTLRLDCDRPEGVDPVRDWDIMKWLARAKELVGE